ncbi:MAG TPA: 30S ribosomal protein S6 [Bryobacteraceae bacterium]|nr:30S ribosomal protein S6 [Bryobacteraceae bacterium]
MRVYEELFILKPDAPEEEADAFIGQIKDLITNGKGTIEKADKWGTRKLAYRVQKYNEGVYVLIQFSSSPDLVKEVERRMRVTDMVIKFITVRIDEKAKKIEKRKKQREKRAARRPAPPPMAVPSAPAAPALPSEPAPVAPGLPGASAAAAETPVSSPVPSKES